MPYLRYIFYLLIILVVFTNCAEKAITDTKGNLTENRYAINFNIYEINDGYIIRIKGSNNENYEYLLSKSDEKKQNGETIIKIPVERVVCFSSTHCAFIDKLDESSTIKAVSGTQYIYNNTIRQKIKDGDIIEAGYENRIDYEKIVSTNPDLVFAYNIDQNSNAALQKFDDFDIPVVYINDFIEPDIRGRTEWLKVFACFYDNLGYAMEYCDSVFDSYNNIKTSINIDVDKQPLVLSSMPWKGVWWSPGGKSYFSQIISDAGGNYIFSDNETTESIPYSIEEIFNKAKNINFWLNPNNYTSKKQMLDAESRLKYFEAYNSAEIYNNNKRLSSGGGNDFWESGILHPDIILKDLIKIFHPEEMNEHQLYYYRKLY
jgi:iron complex transport system substrate-binding protein